MRSLSFTWFCLIVCCVSTFAQSTSELPLSVDNSLSKHFPPIIDQMGGSCAQAANIGYLFTYEMNLLLDRDASASPHHRYSYLYTWNFVNGGKNEGSMGIEGMNIALGTGLMSEALFPKQTSVYQFCWPSGYDKYYEASHYRCVKFRSMELCDSSDLQGIKGYLYNKNGQSSAGKGGVVTFSSKAGNWQFDNDYQGPSQTGYRSVLLKLSTIGAHAMTIVGYDDLVEFITPDGNLCRGAFIVANSYGTWMHSKGRFYLPYWFFLQERDNLSLSHDVTAAEVAYVPHPKLMFRVKLRYNSRDDLAFRFGVSERSSDSRPQHDFEVPIAHYQGGDYPMQGQNGSEEIDFGFDFSSYAKVLDGMPHPNFFLTVLRHERGNKLGNGCMLAFEVYDYRSDPAHPTIYRHNKVLGTILEKGENIFSIPTKQPDSCSYSPVQWLNQQGQPIGSTLLFRTANGRYAKVRFGQYNREKGQLDMRYVVFP